MAIFLNLIWLEHLEMRTLSVVIVPLDQTLGPQAASLVASYFATANCTLVQNWLAKSSDCNVVKHHSTMVQNIFQ